eukprot:3444265-Rhodomonas_salina.1
MHVLSNSCPFVCWYKSAIGCATGTNRTVCSTGCPSTANSNIGEKLEFSTVTLCSSGCPASDLSPITNSNTEYYEHQYSYRYEYSC